ncbi:MAG: hypothetical protein AAF296_03745 [Pseudomonadota bacterium]
MKAHTASLLNALTLIAMSAWAYFASETPSVTALIPAAFGVALILCLPGVKSENKIVAHIAVVLTLIVFVALFMPLRSALGRADTVAIIRIGLMMATTALAFVFFIKSFIDARKARET